MLHVFYNKLKYRYYVFNNNYNIHIEEALLPKIISLEEINEIVKKFNAYFDCFGWYYFTNEQDAENCCDYLNETYGVILKLMGES